MRERDIQIHFMLNEDEFRHLDSISHRTGVSFSGIIRNLIMGFTLKERPNADFLTLARSFDKIGSNINQIAKKANTENTVTNAELEEVKHLLKVMRSEMNRWKKTWQ